MQRKKPANKTNRKKPQTRKKAGRKKKTGHQGGPKKPPHMDPALRQAWLEKYAARTGKTSYGNINTSLRMRQATLDHWLADSVFRDEMADIDTRRMAGALEIAVAFWPDAVRIQGEIATMVSDGPPDLSGVKTKDERLRMLDQYGAMETKKLGMTTRSAEFLADLLGARKKNLHVEGEISETFGRLPKEPDKAVVEIDRLEEVKERYKQRMLAAAEALDDDPAGDGD